MAPPVKIDDVSVRVMCCFLLILVERCIFIQLHSAIRASEGAVVDTAAAAAASQLFCSVHKHVSSRFGIPVIVSRLVRTALWWMTARQVAGQKRARSDFFVRPTGCVCVVCVYYFYLFISRILLLLCEINDEINTRVFFLDRFGFSLLLFAIFSLLSTCRATKPEQRVKSLMCASTLFTF